MTAIIALAIPAFLGALLTIVGFIRSAISIGRRGKRGNITVKLPDGDRTIDISQAKPEEIVDFLNEVQKHSPSA